jgi:hypothetical protein
MLATMATGPVNTAALGVGDKVAITSAQSRAKNSPELNWSEDQKSKGMVKSEPIRTPSLHHPRNLSHLSKL